MVRIYMRLTVAPNFIRGVRVHDQLVEGEKTCKLALRGETILECEIFDHFEHLI